MSDGQSAVLFIAALGLAAFGTFMTFVVAPRANAWPSKWRQALHSAFFLPLVGLQAYREWDKDPEFTSLWTSLWVGLSATLAVAAIIGLFRPEKGRTGGKEGFE